MTAEQRAAYDDAERINSDPFGLWSRDNRNHANKLNAIISATAAELDDHVLEVGCGHGLHAEWFSSHYGGFTAVDISASLCAQTRQRIAEGTVLQADATELPLPEDSVDAVVGTAVLHHLPDVQDALAEWRRVARKSVTVIEPNYLFPKDFATAHLVAEEQHKTQMAPWRLRDDLAALTDDWRLEPRIFTPPWPEALAAEFDLLDRLGERVPGLRWLSQMLLIHTDAA